MNSRGGEMGTHPISRFIYLVLYPLPPFADPKKVYYGDPG